MDAAPAAVVRCQARVAGARNVTVEQGRLPDDWPAGPFDLVVLSEVAYYLDGADVDASLDRCVASLAPGGHLVSVHWSQVADDFRTPGHEVHRRIGVRPELVAVASYEDKDFRLDVRAAAVTPAPEEIGVVVPAHDEERRIGACLASLRVAARHPALEGRRLRVVVVLDACSDRTGDRVARDRDVDIVEVAHRSVGPARSAGFDHLLRAAGVADHRHWLATTDADSLVPADWLARQLEWRRRGADAVAGTVDVRDWSEQPASVRHHFERHQRSHGLGFDHPHVHGANLGLRPRPTAPPAACPTSTAPRTTRCGTRSARQGCDGSARPTSR